MQKVDGSSPFIRLGFRLPRATLMPQTSLTLEWQPRQLHINWRSQHTVAARIAAAPNGRWYVAWKEADGWSIGETGNLTEPVVVQPRLWQLPERDDAELVGSAWALGLTDQQVRRHFAYHLEGEVEASSVSWECRTCRVGGVDNPSTAVASTRARAHWRRELRARVDEGMTGH